MFGMEKKPNEPFAFDLEEDMKKDPTKAKALLKEVDERTNELKNLLRQGAETEDFDDYGVLLHGYAALQKVLKKVIDKQ
ncbi:MAG: DUF5398 family protein [Simkaniaceae bacterium]|nr:DUF5398 family protein [Candidatus Sacchlamyda saccharinae]